MQVFVSRNPSDEKKYWIKGIVKNIISPPLEIEYDENGIVVRLIDGQIGVVVEILDFDELTEYQILRLASGGETENVEFKETFAVANDTHEQVKCLRDAVVKEIASFMNTGGGTLLIGVDDAGKITGLEHDYKYVEPLRTTQTIQDKFKQEIHSYVQGKLLDSTLESNYIITIKNIQDMDVGIVQVTSSEKPVFVEEKIKFTKCMEERDTKGVRQLFYMRTDSGTQKLDSRKIYDYWTTHTKC